MHEIIQKFFTHGEYSFSFFIYISWFMKTVAGANVS